VARLFFPGGLDPVLDGGVGDEDAVIPPEVPTGRPVGQAIFSDQTNGPLLDAARVQAVGQSQVGEIAGEATAAVETAMAGERDNQIDRAAGAGVAKVMQGAAVHGVATGTVTTARAEARGPVAAAPLDTWLGQVLDTRDALGDIRDILTWTRHGCSPDVKGFRSSAYEHRGKRRLH
jgi:hypothetical protein